MSLFPIPSQDLKWSEMVYHYVKYFRSVSNMPTPFVMAIQMTLIQIQVCTYKHKLIQL